MLSSRFVLVNFGPHNSRAKNFRTAANSTKTVERQRGNLPRIHYVLKLIKKALMCVASAPDSTRPMMIGEVLAISLAVPAISLANWPMAFFDRVLQLSMCRFCAPEIKILPEGTIWPRSPSRLFCDLTMVRRRFEGFLMGCIGLFWL